MFGFGMQEMVIIGIVAILLFGKRLPEVARTWGKYYTEFRRGLSDIQSQMDMSDVYSSRPSSSSYTKSSHTSSDDYDDYDEATAPKFEPPPSEPREEPA
jgi:sec-independent protein translocase protein TatA